MPSKFKPVVKRARFALSPFSPEQMQALGEVVAARNKERITAGINAQDQPAKPLKPRYARSKVIRGLQAIRDWKWTGRTLRGLRVLAATENSVKVGFSDPVAAQRASIQNRRERQFAISPADMRQVVEHVRGMNPVKVKTTAA